MKRMSGITKSGILVGLLVAVAGIASITALLCFDITGQKGSGLAKEFIYNIEGPCIDSVCRICRANKDRF